MRAYIYNTMTAAATTRESERYIYYTGTECVRAESESAKERDGTTTGDI